MHPFRKPLLKDIFWLLTGTGLCCLYIYCLNSCSLPWWKTMLFATAFLLQAITMWRIHGPGAGSIALLIAALHAFGAAVLLSSPYANPKIETERIKESIRFFYFIMALAPFWVLIKHFLRKKKLKKLGLLF